MAANITASTVLLSLLPLPPISRRRCLFAHVYRYMLAVALELGV